MKLEETLGVLFDANVEFVLIGGAAMQMRGSAHLRNHRELNFTLMTDLGALDFLGEVADVGDYVEVKKNSDLMAILEMDCLVLSLDGLIRAKKAVGRERGLAVIPELEGLLDLRKRSQK